MCSCRFTTWAAYGAVLSVVLLAACTPAQYAKWADRDAYRTLREGQSVALGRAVNFDVSYRPYCPEDHNGGSIRVGEKVITIGAEGEPTVLTLEECLQIAFQNSREFQDRKESLYSEALELANLRRGWWPPLLGGSLKAEAQHTRQANDPSSEVNEGSAALGPTLTQKLIGGGALVLGATIDLATEFTGINDTTIGSLLEANFTQPLLRGAWRGLAYEQQYRKERDFLLSVFEYDRFTQTFAVQIVKDYYKVLRARDELENDRTNIKRLRQTLALTKVLVQGGQRSRIEEDQANQDLLNAQIRLETSEQTYRNRLDEFKITLGLPVGANIELDYPGALQALNDQGPKTIPFDESEAIETAMSTRPDVLRQRARLRDAERDVEVAADAFLPQLDVTLGISAAGTEPRRPQMIRLHAHERLAGVEFNYQLDQTDNRDAYRRALIAWDRARRQYDEFVDQVVLDVKQSYRTLLRSRRSYELQVRNVEIARRRRKLAALQQKEGQASARDVLEAEEALRNAQNGMTRQLIDYTTTRLDFLARLGMLIVDERGRLSERSEPFTFRSIAERYADLDVR